MGTVSGVTGVMNVTCANDDIECVPAHGVKEELLELILGGDREISLSEAVETIFRRERFSTDVACEFTGDVEVHAEVDAAVWTCPDCGHRNEISAEE